MMKMVSSNFMITAGFFLALAILTYIGLLSYRNMATMAEYDRWEMHSYKEIRELDELLSALKDVETGSRGYIITGSERYLEPYHQALGVIDLKLKDLHRLAREIPSQQKRLAIIEPLVADKLAMSRASIEQRKTKGYRAAHQLIMTEKGKNVMDAIRANVAAAQGEEARLLKERAAAKAASTTKAYRALAAGSIVSLTLLLAVFLLLNNEIRQRVRTEEELRRHQDHLEELVQYRTAQLEQARLQAEAADHAKSEFLANMSHEMRTPLTGVMGVIDLLLLEGLPEESRRYLDLAKKSAQALNRLIDDILEFSRLASEKIAFTMEPFDLRTCVRSVTNMYALEADRKRLRFTVEIDDRVPDKVIGNEGRLRQVLANLIGNAVKFTQQGGVDVSVGVARDSARPEERMLLFAVRDTGIGIPADSVKTIFEKFSQLDTSSTKRFGGAGLGLAFSMRIVENLGGKLWVESRPGEGSVFSFSIPLLGDRSRLQT